MAFTLCWNCEKATGGCSWSNSLKPVKDWNATLVEPSNTRLFESYMVHDCPLFVRDAMHGGQVRLRNNRK